MNLIYTHRIYGSIYSAFTYIYLYKHKLDGGKHTSPMDCMGYFWKTDILTYQEGYFCKFPQLTTIDKVFGHRVNYIIENIQI